MKKLDEEAIRLTHEVLVRYWQRDYMFAIENCMNDVIWVGSRQDEFQIGVAATQADFERAVKELQPCHLVDAEYHIAASGLKFCAVVGRYLVTTDSSADYYLQVQQRCSFVWVKTDVGLKISHLHISNPIGELKIAPNEAFPNTIGKMAHRYLMNRLEHTSNNDSLSVYGDGGSLHFIHLSDILYVAALDKDSVITTVNGDFYCKTGINEIAKQAKPRLLSIHRSYLVNPEYVSTLERYNVIMANGKKLPVPAKRFNEVRDQMVKVHLE